MNKKLIEQIKTLPGVKGISQTPFLNQVVVTFEAEDYRDIIEKAHAEGKLIEYTSLMTEEWFLLRKPIFNWDDYDYRIADLCEVLHGVANINQSAANSIAKWMGACIDIF